MIELKGIACPHCGCRRHHVYYSRKKSDGSVERRHVCENEYCGRQFTSKEKVI